MLDNGFKLMWKSGYHDLQRIRPLQMFGVTTHLLHVLEMMRDVIASQLTRKRLLALTTHFETFQRIW
jgi:hypothetical protein